MAGFRQDLYARPAGFEMTLPVLRDRLGDLGTLIAAILPRVSPERCAPPSPSPTPARSSSSAAA
jgi:DNA-binding NtrC family response regulator